MGADGEGAAKRKADAGPQEGGPSKKAATARPVNPKRVRELRRGAVEGDGPVIYW